METTYIEHNGKQYEVKEPTINTWKNVMIFKDLLDEEEMSIKMIAEELRETNYGVTSTKNQNNYIRQ
jgi:hypothetical protein